MSSLLFLVGVVILIGAIYWINTRKPKPQPPVVEPRPFEPLKDYLEGKIPPALPRYELPKERPLPKRSHHKAKEK